MIRLITIVGSALALIASRGGAARADRAEIAQTARGEPDAQPATATIPAPAGVPSPFPSPARAAPAALAPLPTNDAPVDVICKAAVEMAQADPERARGFVTRARLAGWLPDVAFRVYRRFARTEGLSFEDSATGTVAPVDISAIDDVRYEWRATWDLSRMVFNPDELQAHFEALRMSDVRRELQTLVIRLYFERRRLVLENQAPSGPDLMAPERRVLRISEIEAQLDALSNGAFSRGSDRRGDDRREATHAP